MGEWIQHLLTELDQATTLVALLTFLLLSLIAGIVIAMIVVIIDILTHYDP